MEKMEKEPDEYETVVFCTGRTCGIGYIEDIGLYKPVVNHEKRQSLLK